MGGIAATGLTVATSVAAKLKAAVRTVAISVINKSGKEWQAINVYFNAGISNEVMPKAVPSGMQHFIAELSIVIILTNMP